MIAHSIPPRLKENHMHLKIGLLLITIYLMIVKKNQLIKLIMKVKHLYTHQITQKKT